MPVAAAAASTLADQEAPPEVLTWSAAEPAAPARTDTCTDRTTVAETRSVPAEFSIQQKRLEPQRVQQVRSGACGVFCGPSSGR
jgi:hypothetical protein